MHGHRRFVADGAVRANLVIVSTPVFQFQPGVVKAHEPMCVQTFRPEAAIKTLPSRQRYACLPGDEQSRSASVFPVRCSAIQHPFPGTI